MIWKKLFWLSLFIIFNITILSCSDNSSEVDNLCENVECGENTHCNDGKCFCNEGYYSENYNIPLICIEKNIDNPCENVQCGENAYCDNGNCFCNEGYYSENYQLPLNCIQNSVENPCEGVNCSNLGSCTELNGEPVCICDEGYHAEGLYCIENSVENPCENVQCGENAHCDNGDCFCNEGYHNITGGIPLYCVENGVEDPCDNVQCGENAHCDNGDCFCNEGYHNITGGVPLYCVENSVEDPCEGVNCSNLGSCTELNGEPVCICDEGYHAEGLYCVENSVENPCENVDCGDHSYCDDGECYCDNGYTMENSLCVDIIDHEPLYFLHITDSHLYERDDLAFNSMKKFIDQILPIVDPDILFHTGDITDDGSEAPFILYSELISSLTYPQYIETTGNHDMKSDGNHGEFFKIYTLTGSEEDSFYGVSYVNTEKGRVRVIRTHTSESRYNLVNINGTFSEEQYLDLLSMIDNSDDIIFSVVLAHHPFSGINSLDLQNSSRMKDLITTSLSKLYLCGHTHIGNTSWYNDTLSVTTDSLNPSDEEDGGSFSLIAVDNGILSVKEFETEMEWPILMITSSDKQNYGDRIKIKALSFSPSGIDSLYYSIENGEWIMMNRVSNNFFSSEISLNDLSLGDNDIEVKAVSLDGEVIEEFELDIEN